MKRKIITIDEDLCNGCGNCVTACSEGALKIVNGKAKLVKEQFCDGFGDCIGECPTGALKMEEREAPEFDEKATLEHVKKIGGEEAVHRFKEAAKRHEIKEHMATHMHGGCPGSRQIFRKKAEHTAHAGNVSTGGVAIKSDLEQWPVQLHLVRPDAEFFKGRELVLLSTCSPVASVDIHWRFIRGRGVAVGCPKLDDTDGYAEKMGMILSEPTIPKVIVVRMEVPCCGGLTEILKEGIRLSGRKDLQAEEVTLSLSGEVIKVEPIEL